MASAKGVDNPLATLAREEFNAAVTGLQVAKLGLGDQVMEAARMALNGLSEAMQNPEMQHVAANVDKGEGRSV